MDPKTTTPPPTQAQVLAEVQAHHHRPQPYVMVEALPTMGAFDDLPADARADAGEGADGWTVSAERVWRLEPLGNFRVYLSPGMELEEALARLDRARAELVARPELLSADWTRPLPSRPSLRVVRPPKL